jgi:hypothetical protein
MFLWYIHSVVTTYNTSNVIPMLIIFHFYISTVIRMRAVAIDCSSLILCFPHMLIKYFLNDSEMVWVAPIITGITFVFTFHVHCISTERSVYFRIFVAYYYYYYCYYYYYYYTAIVINNLKLYCTVFSLMTYVGHFHSPHFNISSTKNHSRYFKGRLWDFALQIF